MSQQQQQRELSRRGAAAAAHATRGRARIVSPDKTKYSRKRGKAVDRE